MQESQIKNFIHAKAAYYMQINLFSISLMLFQYNYVAVYVPVLVLTFGDCLNLHLTPKGNVNNYVGFLVGIAAYAFVICNYYTKQNMYGYASVFLIIQNGSELAQQYSAMKRINQEYSQLIKFVLLFVSIYKSLAQLTIALKFQGVITINWPQTLWSVFVLIAAFAIMIVLISLILLANCFMKLQTKDRIYQYKLDTFLTVYILIILILSTLQLVIWCFNTFYLLGLHSFQFGIACFIAVATFNILVLVLLTRRYYKELEEFLLMFLSTTIPSQQVSVVIPSQNELKTISISKSESSTIPAQFLVQISDNYYRYAINDELTTRQQDICTTRALDENLQIQSQEVVAIQIGDCSVCQDHIANSVLMNCGHGGICISCARDVITIKNECFLCRAKVDNILEIAIELKIRVVSCFDVILSYN